MSIALDPAVERLLQEKLNSGNYNSPSDLVSAALTALSQQEKQDAALADLCRKVAEGAAAVKQGKFSDGDEFFAELEREEQVWLNSKKSA